MYEILGCLSFLCLSIAYCKTPCNKQNYKSKRCWLIWYKTLTLTLVSGRIVKLTSKNLRTFTYLPTCLLEVWLPDTWNSKNDRHNGFVFVLFYLFIYLFFCMNTFIMIFKNKNMFISLWKSWVFPDISPNPYWRNRSIG